MRPLHRRLSLLLGAAVAVAVTTAACSSDGAGPTAVPGPTTAATAAADPTTTAVTKPTTTTTMSEAEALAIVEAAFEAHNSGDIDTWLLWREGGSAGTGHGDYDRAVESRFDVKQCTHRGFGVWQMDGPITGHGFDCEVTLTDLLLGAAGIELKMTYNWVIGQGPDTSLGGSNEDFEFVDAFLAEFRAWLVANHPEVEESIQYEFESSFPTANSVPTALEYIDEFVAQSDDLPLTEPVPAGDYGGPLP